MTAQVLFGVAADQLLLWQGRRCGALARRFVGEEQQCE
jgi:hypothetical protein